MGRKPRIENQLELIKYLHKPHTLEDCRQHLKREERTVRSLLEDPEITFMNTSLPIYTRKIKNDSTYLSDSNEGVDGSSVIEGADYKYRSTVHPIFLALNMTEVYMLTQHLLGLVEASSREELQAYKMLVDKIYTQLSQPTRDRIDKLARHRHYLDVLDSVKYESEEEMFKRYNKSLLQYAFKAGEKVRIILKDDTNLEGNVLFERDGLYLLTDQNEKLKIAEFYNQISIVEKIPNIGR